MTAVNPQVACCCLNQQKWVGNGGMSVQPADAADHLCRQTYTVLVAVSAALKSPQQQLDTGSAKLHWPAQLCCPWLVPPPMGRQQAAIFSMPPRILRPASLTAA